MKRYKSPELRAAQERLAILRDLRKDPEQQFEVTRWAIQQRTFDALAVALMEHRRSPRQNEHPADWCKRVHPDIHARIMEGLAGHV